MKKKLLISPRAVMMLYLSKLITNDRFVQWTFGKSDYYVFRVPKGQKVQGVVFS